MTYYSRRQLEALGEPLGDSVTRKEGGRIIYGGGGSGGGGSPAPTQTTTYSTNVPEYARPYVENMLESTQKQIYTDDMGGFRPYKPYSTNVSDYVAGFSPLQQSAQQAAYNLQTPGEYGAATGLAGISGLGALGAGQQFAAGVTNPFVMQSYMSPYQQGVTDVAKAAAVREAQIAQNTQNLAAARQGTYGGARQLLAQTERERNLLSNLSNIQAQGSQAAYDRALQAQQFGANLGLQGYGQATQAAGALGQLGSQQLGAQKEIIGLQSQMGAQQQALEQQKINQAIQDYAIAQQYPFMQLGMMNAMLRGLPLQTQTTQLYQAQPTALQQGVGLLGAGASLFGKKEGGVIKSYREGGITEAYAPGGVIDSTRADLEEIADMPGGMQRLEQIKNSSASPEVRKMAAQIIMTKQMEERAEQQTQQARMSGIALGGGPAFETVNAAGGGIVAFNGEEESLVRGEAIDPETGEPYKTVNPITRFGQFMSPFSGPGSFGSIARQGKSIEETYNKPKNVSAEDRTRQAQAEAQDIQEGPGVVQTAAKAEEKQTGTKGATGAQAAENKAAAQGPNSFAKYLAEIKGAGPKGQFGAEYEKFLEERLGKSAERLGRDERMAMAKGFLKFASTPAPGGIGQAAAAGLTEYATGVEAARKTQDTMEAEAQKARMELDKARRAEERGDVAAAREAYDKYEDRMNRIKTAQISAGAAGAAQKADAAKVERVMRDNPGMTYLEALQAVGSAGKFESTEAQKAKIALESIDARLGLMGKKDPRRAELEAQRAEIIRLLTPGGGIGGGQTTQTTGAVPGDIQSILNKYPPQR